MQNIYLIRLDDACPTMDSERWTYMESLLDKYEIKPMVGIVPDNQDNNLKIEKKDCDFWRKAQKWEKKVGLSHCMVMTTVIYPKKGGME